MERRLAFVACYHAGIIEAFRVVLYNLDSYTPTWSLVEVGPSLKRAKPDHTSLQIL